MSDSNHFFRSIGLADDSGGIHSGLVKNAATTLGIPLSRLHYYNDNNIVPTGQDLEVIKKKYNISQEELMLRMGHFSKDLLEAIRAHASDILKITSLHKTKTRASKVKAKIVHKTKLGSLYQGDCLEMFRDVESDSVECIFADPPFNLNKLYPSKMNDNLKAESYIEWCHSWLEECSRTLKHGGSLFLWNLPKWNSILTNFLHGKLTFKHWITVDIKYSLPIQGRLYPSHYSLLYFVKGDKPNTFKPDRLPMQTCPHCYGDLKDYGGYKDKMNPLGINLTDVWLDIPPVRHAKYKRRVGSNELSIKLLDRIIELSTKEGDIVLDPFGGSGTTYVTAELKKRKWIGCEIGPTEVIIDRFKLLDEEGEILKAYRKNINNLFPDKIKKERIKRELWICDCSDQRAEMVY